MISQKILKKLQKGCRMQEFRALTIHGRTRAQLYKGEADWSLIAKVKSNPRMHIPIFGNGDIDTPEKALDYKNRYGVDGIMIGRAAIGYPWIFEEIKYFIKKGGHAPPPSIEQRIETIRQHLDRSMEWKGVMLGILEMRRHYTNYLKGLPHIKEFRSLLVQKNTAAEIYEILDQISRHYSGITLARPDLPFSPSELEAYAY